MGYPDDEDRFPWPYAKKLTIACAALLVVAIFAPQCGCATVSEDERRRAEAGVTYALDEAWACLGRTDRPPRVRVMTGAELSCISPISGLPGFPVAVASDDLHSVANDCREGYTISFWEVMVARHASEPWSRTTLVHELGHAVLLRQGIIFDHHPGEDPQHGGPIFPAGGPVDQCNAKMAEAGR